MKFSLALLALLLLTSTSAEARHRPHVVVSKPYPYNPIVSVPVAVIPVFGMFYDLARRTNCQGDVLGLGGPGFSEPMPVGNVMTTAYMRGECNATPR
jgi:hypothetical protein